MDNLNEFELSIKKMSNSELMGLEENIRNNIRANSPNNKDLKEMQMIILEEDYLRYEDSLI